MYLEAIVTYAWRLHQVEYMVIRFEFVANVLLILYTIAKLARAY